MASATIMKFPDGRTETRNVLSNFEKNNMNIIVFETDKVDNGHKVVGVSLLSDGMYQNIIDANQWKDAKGYLVDILHDRMDIENYRLVPEEVMVTVDPYHPLGLRDENLDKIVASYDSFKATKQISVPSPEAVEPVPEIVESLSDIQEPVTDISNAAPVIDTPTQVDISPMPTIDLGSEVDPNVTISETIVDPISITEAPAVEPSIVADGPVIAEEAKEEKILDPFAIAASLDPVVEAHQDIIPPVGIDTISDSVLPGINPAVDNINQVVNTVAQPVETNIEIPSIVDQAPTTSVVQDSYLKKTDSYIQSIDEITSRCYAKINAEINAITSRYLAEMQEELNAFKVQYTNELQEIRSEISSNLEEARGINELSKQTYDRAQENAQNIVSFDQEQVLGLTKVA